MLYQISPKAHPLPNALAFQRVSLGPRGARDADCKNPLAPGAIPLLDPAGPAAAAFISDQPLGAEAGLCPASPRRCRAITDVEWQKILDDVPRAPHLGLLVGEDNLLMSHWRTGAIARVIGLTQHARARCDRLSIFLTASEDVPGGLDLHDGREMAGALAGIGADVLVVTSGSARLPALMNRASDVDQGRRANHFCRTARSILPQPIPILAWTKDVPTGVAREAALTAELDGVCVELSREGF